MLKRDVAIVSKAFEANVAINAKNSIRSSKVNCESNMIDEDDEHENTLTINDEL
jgi:hypothetical protein